MTNLQTKSTEVSAPCIRKEQVGGKKRSLDDTHTTFVMPGEAFTLQSISETER